MAVCLTRFIKGKIGGEGGEKFFSLAVDKNRR
jgi:hypothetical protein